MRISDRITEKAEMRVLFNYSAPVDYSNDQKVKAWLNQPLKKNAACINVSIYSEVVNTDIRYNIKILGALSHCVFRGFV